MPVIPQIVSTSSIQWNCWCNAYFSCVLSFIHNFYLHDFCSIAKWCKYTNRRFKFYIFYDTFYFLPHKSCIEYHVILFSKKSLVLILR